MNDLISVIIPVYNVEKYLEKCVNSVINQTYSNIEIILVDDGSTDSSGKMCEELSKMDKRVKVFHKKNGGLSDARNYGIDKAIGEYICFVDSDDFVTKDMCEILYGDIKKFNVDVAFCSFIDCYGNIPIVNNNIYERYKLTKKEAIEYVMIGDKVPISAVAKLYKKSVFDKVRFTKGKTYEDALIMIELLDNCENISFNTSKVYYYIHRMNSITTKKFSKNNYDVIYAYKKNYKIIQENIQTLLI